jgi:RNA polymerase sigma-70 factor (family 1)
MPDKEDKKSIHRLQQGDKQVFRDYYDLYNKRLYSFAFQYLKSRELAEDAVQDIFLKLWVHRREVNSSIKGFLFTSVRNHVLNMIRNNKSKMLKKIQLEQQRKQTDNRTENEVLYSEYQKILTRTLEELPDGKREIFELKTYQGLSNEEIAAKLDITIHTVKSQYYQASKFVKIYLEEHAGIKAKG